MCGVCTLTLTQSQLWMCALIHKKNKTKKKHEYVQRGNQIIWFCKNTYKNVPQSNSLHMTLTSFSSGVTFSPQHTQTHTHTMTDIIAWQVIRRAIVFSLYIRNPHWKTKDTIFYAKYIFTLHLLSIWFTGSSFVIYSACITWKNPQVIRNANFGRKYIYSIVIFCLFQQFSKSNTAALTFHVYYFLKVVSESFCKLLIRWQHMLSWCPSCSLTLTLWDKAEQIQNAIKQCNWMCNNDRTKP